MNAMRRPSGLNDGVTLSLPSVVAKGGVREVLCPQMSDAEASALSSSAERLAKVLKPYL